MKTRCQIKKPPVGEVVELESGIEEDILFPYIGVFLGVDGSALLQGMGLCFFYLTTCPAKDVIVFVCFSEVIL